MIDTPYERIWITVHYACNCVYARPVRPPRLQREIFSMRRCDIHKHEDERAKERLVEQAALDAERRAAYHLEQRQLQTQRYLVNGMAMSITQSKDGCWRGKCQVSKGKQVQKYFGKVDPRPLLVVAP